MKYAIILRNNKDFPMTIGKFSPFRITEISRYYEISTQDLLILKLTYGFTAYKSMYLCDYFLVNFTKKSFADLYDILLSLS